MTAKPKPRTFEVTALFGGIGGLELGLSSSGHRASTFCELDPEAATILKSHFPDATLTRDIRNTQEVAAAIGARSELLTAGFPCTDLSQAGRAQGFAGGRSSLVRDALRLLAARPFAHVLLENVPNWRVLHKGAYLAEVVTALEQQGYRWAYRTVDALAFGAPQRRLRIFLYATREGDPRDVLFHGDVAPPTTEFSLEERAHGFYWTEGTRGLGWGEDCVPTLKGGSSAGVPSPPAILLPSSATATAGLRLITPDIRDAERLQGFPADWSRELVTLDGSEFRHRRRWLLVGNAVSVRVAAWLGQRLAEPVLWAGDPGRPLEDTDSWPAAAYGDRTGRFAASVGSWPVAMPREPLADFLRYPGAPLSSRATAGFLGRLLASRLRIRPGFVDALRDHLGRIDAASGISIPSARAKAA
ncbi:DNA cytosine methyltransferase [Phenylobacterium sp. 58.2.17]|uniref:DNA cytosine methyltransferase n=1 Tax=Phenylobacterium sp. 58.2.17 TaxID=2969306 RepID=UPI00226496AF|nr:DNA (cytosine-5-)-methyltransferase [Phenylobacterium sp. 58.2.17]MCX7584911.1 DNA (cytosine-5-)-methyltransferase [Phenylobacterium sp. 58.2.17]